MEQNEVFSYNEKANTIMDETVANQDYKPVCGAACTALAAIAVGMVWGCVNGRKTRKAAKKAKKAKKAAKKCFFFKK